MYFIFVSTVYLGTSVVIIKENVAVHHIVVLAHISQIYYGTTYMEIIKDM
jgi:hypothetical protein